MFKDACESCGLRKETAGMFIGLGREFVRLQFKETLGSCGLMEMFVKKYEYIKKENKERKNFNRKSAKPKPNRMSEAEFEAGAENGDMLVEGRAAFSQLKSEEVL